MEDLSSIVEFENEIFDCGFEVAYYRLSWSVGNNSKLRRVVHSHWARPIEDLAELLYQRQASVGDVHDIHIQGVRAEDFF